ncbi:MAG: ribosome biogenesis GTPase [Desulforhopalus sp.]|jgi:ribosome biogenesis GTPase
MNTLKKLGYSNWFQDHIDAEKSATHEIARVVSVHRDSYVITNGSSGEVFAEGSGSLLFTADSPSDLPTTGDFVYADFYDDESHAIIHGVLPRRTVLKRKAAGKLVDFQLIASNIDVAFIVQSVDNNLNLRRLERYLVMVNESRITPVILLSKCDLIACDEAEKIKMEVLCIAPTATVLLFSNVEQESVDIIKQSMLPEHTYCLLGSSGVGKTTLLNNILGHEHFETQAVSKKENKGRHTTTRRELILLDNGALLIDTPGMRELGNISVDTGIDETFSDITELTYQCKFGDCSHTGEQGCAILMALKDGKLDEQRYQNYVKMKKESAFNEMTYSEKKKKDKDFGKLIKATMKSKKRRY